ncbi:MAG: alpha/beta fold hydrolase [Pirellulales bacterium]|nr:alpha/beta fold hydrolase [Pirellulales bacterium]
MKPPVSPYLLRYQPLLLFIAFVFLSANPSFAQSSDLKQAVSLSRKYLASTNDDEQRQLEKQLAILKPDLDAVVAELRNHSYEPVKPGYFPEQHFFDPQRLKKHPDDLLYFTVPKSYQPDRPTGLIIFLHGGGGNTPRKAPADSMNFPHRGETEEDSSQLGNLFESTGMIAVGPSAPWNERSNNRWCLPDADEYLADVIAECKSRFNIDPNRVILLGHSMGGFGAFHHAQRQPDRFAAVIIIAGAFKTSYWPATRGTSLCIIQAVQDAMPKERWHYTDIAFGRLTNQLLSQHKIDHAYLEHNGHHGLNFAKKRLAEFLKSADKLKRDPYAPQIALATPVGFSRSYLYPVQHNRWLTLDEPTEGTIPVDELRDNGSKNFDDWKLSHVTSELPGALIEAVNRGDNTIDVTASNVRQFTVWLHPRMIDLSRPVKIIVNGKQRFLDVVSPSLPAALDSYQRRHDWGMIYPIMVRVDIE